MDVINWLWKITNWRIGYAAIPTITLMLLKCFSNGQFAQWSWWIVFSPMIFFLLRTIAGAIRILRKGRPC